MITTESLRNIPYSQARKEILLCLEDDPNMSVAMLAERLLIDFDLIEEIMGSSS